MKLWSATAAAFLIATPAFAQGVPRIKAAIQSFDGQTLTVTSGTGKNVQTTAVEVLPTTRILREEKRPQTDIVVGNYIGATVTSSRDGVLHAQEIHIFPEELHGTSEGIFAAGTDRSMIDAKVTAIAAGSVSVIYRGSGAADGPACTGRAPRVGGCQGSVTLVVAGSVPVTALLPGDKSLLVPGAVVTASVMAGGDGKMVTPGLTVESAPPPVSVKPAGK